MKLSFAGMPSILKQRAEEITRQMRDSSIVVLGDVMLDEMELPAVWRCFHSETVIQVKRNVVEEQPRRGGDAG